MPTCSTLQRACPTVGPTCSDHFQPGSYVARPMVIPPMRTSSNRPFTIFRTSSGWANRFRTTSISADPISVRNPPPRRTPWAAGGIAT